MSTAAVQTRSIPKKAPPILPSRSRPGISTCVLVLTDLLSLFSAIWLAFFSYRAAGADLWTPLYLNTSLTVLTFPLIYATMRLYPGYGINPVEELRKLTVSTSCGYFVLAGMVFFSRTGSPYSRGVYFIAWILSLVSLPLGRSLIRSVVAKRGWWGVEVVILGCGKTGLTIAQRLTANPRLGLKPIAFADDDPQLTGELVCGVPVIGPISLVSTIGNNSSRWGILAMPGIPRQSLITILEKHTAGFSKTLIVPDLMGIGSLWVSSRDLDGCLALEISSRLLSRSAALAKRALDLAFGIVAAIVSFLPLLLISIAIKLDSRGPVFYKHRRIGSGEYFEVWKFRSMVQDADSSLEKHFANNPAVGQEWATSQKLRNDPRITRVGTFLRKSSLDELPQIFNVFLGEMSLVGPRPIVESEIEKYGEKYALYSKVKPGITGLWQVSGRNDTTYEQRLHLDEYYVRNWSVWLDLYILARTIGVVLRGKGAY